MSKVVGRFLKRSKKDNEKRLKDKMKSQGTLVSILKGKIGKYDENVAAATQAIEDAKKALEQVHIDHRDACLKFEEAIRNFTYTRKLWALEYNKTGKQKRIESLQAQIKKLQESLAE
jgi:hypothetical protein